LFPMSDEPSQTNLLSSQPTAGDSDDEQQPVKRPRMSQITHRTNTTPLETQNELTVTPITSSNDPNTTSAKEQPVFENASLQGIAKILDESMFDAVRRVKVGNDSKAAVAMVFPGRVGPVDCLMSLHVREEDVERLAMALFNAEVKWMEQGLRVVRDGFAFIAPEAILKGVPDEAILKVFGSEIHGATAGSPVRWRELAEGKHLTECVSMILTKNGTIISLSLDLEGGLHIRDKLYI